MAVNEGLPNNTNPCLAAEVSWAQVSSGASKQPNRLPDWISGAKTLARAKKNCRLAPLTGGGTVTLTQWQTKPATSDFSCR